MKLGIQQGWPIKQLSQFGQGTYYRCAQPMPVTWQRIITSEHLPLVLDGNGQQTIMALHYLYITSGCQVLVLLGTHTGWPAINCCLLICTALNSPSNREWNGPHQNDARQMGLALGQIEPFGPHQKMHCLAQRTFRSEVRYGTVTGVVPTRGC